MMRFNTWCPSTGVGSLVLVVEVMGEVWGAVLAMVSVGLLPGGLAGLTVLFWVWWVSGSSGLVSSMCCLTWSVYVEDASGSVLGFCLSGMFPGSGWLVVQCLVLSLWGSRFGLIASCCFLWFDLLGVVFLCQWWMLGLLNGCLLCFRVLFFDKYWCCFCIILENNEAVCYSVLLGFLL